MAASGGASAGLGRTFSALRGPLIVLNLGSISKGSNGEVPTGWKGSDEAEPKCAVIGEVQNALTHNQNHTALGDDDGCLELESDHSEESEHEEDALS